jgi:hypothetical protein
MQVKLTIIVKEEMRRKDRIAQWAFDTRPILGRFHLWLEDVELQWERGDKNIDINQNISFVDERSEKLFPMTAAVTALGTKLFGRYGEGKGADKKKLNQVKKDADAISAYAMSESLWYLSRSLPENHAIMVFLGEGLMPKGGETPEMGSNPMLGFGRIYARPQVAQLLDGCVQKLLNTNNYHWDEFRQEINNAGITIWGAAIDTLENTSRFAKGEDTGPVTVLHVFDQPLSITKPYEGYIGSLILPREIVDVAAENSLLIDFFTPREKIVEAIKISHPKIKNENIHIWTLAGKSREPRLGKLWDEWRKLGVHLVDTDWELPTGFKAFTDSGTYAPTFLVKFWKDDKGDEHLFLTDGYAASAEAIQAASLSPILNIDASLAIFSSKFVLSYERESHIMHLNPATPDFPKKLSTVFKKELDEKTIEQYKDDINLASSAGIPLDKRLISIDDFLPEKKWHVMAISGFMLPDPYSGIPGIKKLSKDTYKVSVRFSTRQGDKRITLTLRLLESFEKSRLIFNPLLNRFMRGEDYQERPVKISDSGRIRNELQTLCSEALEHSGKNSIKIHFDQITTDVISLEDQRTLREILTWYKKNHPIWFDWLEQR